MEFITFGLSPKPVERPLALVTGTVREIIIGSIEHLAWDPPFSWADVGVAVAIAD
jgi:hypothetical protein